MKAWDIVGWTYDADVHCEKCAEKRFGEKLNDPETEDSEGNKLHPIFASDDFEEEVCGDCLTKLEDTL